jgi:hypothetical protein
MKERPITPMEKAESKVQIEEIKCPLFPNEPCEVDKKRNRDYKDGRSLEPDKNK